MGPCLRVQGHSSADPIWVTHSYLGLSSRARFTAEVVDIYYESDKVVEDDQELQDFVNDVYVYGMRGKKASGEDLPSRLLLFPVPLTFLGSGGLHLSTWCWALRARIRNSRDTGPSGCSSQCRLPSLGPPARTWGNSGSWLEWGCVSAGPFQREGLSQPVALP